MSTIAFTARSPVNVMSAARARAPVGVRLAAPSDASGQVPLRFTAVKMSMLNVARSKQTLLPVQLPTTSPPHGAMPQVPRPLPPHPDAANDSAPTTAITVALVFVVTRRSFMGGTVARAVGHVNGHGWA